MALATTPAIVRPKKIVELGELTVDYDETIAAKIAWNGDPKRIAWNTPWATDENFPDKNTGKIVYDASAWHFGVWMPKDLLKASVEAEGKILGTPKPLIDLGHPQSAAEARQHYAIGGSRSGVRGRPPQSLRAVPRPLWRRAQPRLRPSGFGRGVGRPLAVPRPRRSSSLTRLSSLLWTPRSPGTPSASAVACGGRFFSDTM